MSGTPVITYQWHVAKGGHLKTSGKVSAGARLRAVADLAGKLAGTFEDQIELLEAVRLYLLYGSLGVNAVVIGDLVAAAEPLVTLVEPYLRRECQVRRAWVDEVPQLRAKSKPRRARPRAKRLAGNGHDAAPGGYNA